MRAALRYRVRPRRSRFSMQEYVPGRVPRDAELLSGGYSVRFARQSEPSRRLVKLFDHVFFDWLYRDAGSAQPCERAFDLVGAAFELDCNQAHLLGDAGAADIEDEIEFLHQLIKDRLLDQGARIAQVVAFVKTFHIPITSSFSSWL